VLSEALGKIEEAKFLLGLVCRLERNRQALGNSGGAIWCPLEKAKEIARLV